MANKPELSVDLNSNSHPISARCSACGAQMPLMESKGASSAESTRWFTIQFDLHAKRSHSREDVKQVSARIGRETRVSD
jgi:hypothetical protein